MCVPSHTLCLSSHCSVSAVLYALLALSIPSVCAGPFPAEQTHRRRNSNKVLSLDQSDQDCSSHREFQEVKGHLVWVKLVKSALGLSLIAMSLGNPGWATNNYLLEKQAGCPAVFHLFTQRHLIPDYLSQRPGKRECIMVSFLNSSLIPRGFKGYLGAKAFLTSSHMLDSSSLTSGL